MASSTSRNSAHDRRSVASWDSGCHRRLRHALLPRVAGTAARAREAGGVRAEAARGEGLLLRSAVRVLAMDRMAGGWVLVLVGVLVAEIVLTLTDFVVEIAVRKQLGDVYAGERVTHAVMGILYGAMVAKLIPMLLDWWTPSNGARRRMGQYPRGSTARARRNGGGRVPVGSARSFRGARTPAWELALEAEHRASEAEMIRRATVHRACSSPPDSTTSPGGSGCDRIRSGSSGSPGCRSPTHPAIFACLGMVVGLYGILYLDVARRPETRLDDRRRGIHRKVLGPVGMVWLIRTGAWPPSALCCASPTTSSGGSRLACTCMTRGRPFGRACKVGLVGRVEDFADSELTLTRRHTSLRVSRNARRILIVIALGVALGLIFITVCSDGGAMAAAYRTCECRGFEWQLYDRTPSDGPRRTLCVGYVRSRTCHQSRGGPVVTCARESR